MMSKLLVRVENLCPGLKSFSTKRKNSSTGDRACSDRVKKSRPEVRSMTYGISPVVRFQFEESTRTTRGESLVE
jgi:hypothetical protein